MDPDGTLRAAPRTTFTSSPSRARGSTRPRSSVTGIDPHHPLRPALPERDALQRDLPRDPPRGTRLRLPARHPGRPQRGFRPWLPQRRRRARRREAQSVPSVLVLRHRDARRRGARADGAGQGGHGGGAGVGSEQRALRAYDAERSAELFCLICNRLRDSYQDAEERARALGWLSAPRDRDRQRGAAAWRAAELPALRAALPPARAATWRRRLRRAASSARRCCTSRARCRSRRPARR